MHLEAVAARDVPLDALCRHQGGVHLEEDVVERGAEVSAVDGGVARRLGVVDILASRAVQLDGLGVGHVREPHRQQGVRRTHDARALAEVGLLILLELLIEGRKELVTNEDAVWGEGGGTTNHLLKAPSSDNVSSMNETVQVPGRLLYCFPHIIVAVEVEDIGDEVESILVVLDLGVEARQVEPIRDVVLVDFAKVLIASRGDELQTDRRATCVSNDMTQLGNFLLLLLDVVDDNQNNPRKHTQSRQ